jgi:hypothetical protein
VKLQTSQIIPAKPKRKESQKGTWSLLLKAEEPLMAKCQYRLHAACNSTVKRLDCLKCADDNRRDWLKTGCDQQDSARYCAHRVYAASKVQQMPSLLHPEHQKAAKQTSSTNKKGSRKFNAGHKKAVLTHANTTPHHNISGKRLAAIACSSVMRDSCNHTLFKSDQSQCRLCAFQHHQLLVSAGCGLATINKVCAAPKNQTETSLKVKKVASEIWKDDDDAEGDKFDLKVSAAGMSALQRDLQASMAGSIVVPTPVPTAAPELEWKCPNLISTKCPFQQYEPCVQCALKLGQRIMEDASCNFVSLHALCHPTCKPSTRYAQWSDCDAPCDKLGWKYRTRERIFHCSEATPLSAAGRSIKTRQRAACAGKPCSATLLKEALQRDDDSVWSVTSKKSANPATATATTTRTMRRTTLSSSAPDDDE